jgi:hypothetical protein
VNGTASFPRRVGLVSSDKSSDLAIRDSSKKVKDTLGTESISKKGLRRQQRWFFGSFMLSEALQHLKHPRDVRGFSASNAHTRINL